MSKKVTLIKRIAYRIFTFFFKKIPILRESAIKALMKDLPDINIFNGLIKFHDCNIIDVMTPRTKICAIDIASSKQDVIKKIKNIHFTKILIYKNDFDNVIGFFYVKDVLLNEDKNFDLKEIVRNVIFVPHSMKTTSLFVKMRSSKSHLAVVLDEYGGTDGLISITDLIEELISNINSKNEPFGYEIVNLSQNKFEISARTLIRDIEENLKIELRSPEEDYSTLGGLILSIAGKLPSVGEVVKYKNGVKFVVKSASERYIDKVILDLGDYKK
ncbi:MAG: CBS domain-containing protein [Wolbachia endosymbiont of Meromenopon meropis]|nr:CBS domain-containing protein [Wolbachia endosymbiont of Meromenopon meropis]